jgi:2-desacetyl-2-hydroxyethyl bacteriochlorophyllide A dehydrogenase
MKAVVKTRREPGIEVLDVQVPHVGETDILVRVVSGSLCGSDVHIYEWSAGYEFMSLPLILGHEFSGEVVKVGAGVERVAEGDRISAMPFMPCGACARCRVGRGDTCTQRLVPGLRSDGFLAEYARLPAGASIFTLPDNVSYENGSMLEPLSVALNAVDISNLKMGYRTAVLGPGPIGLLTLQLLKAGGAGLVMVVGTGSDEGRFKLAEKYGADLIVNVEKEDPVSRVHEITGREGGLDLVFEATGNPKSVSQALEMVKPGGAVLLIGIHSGLAEFDPTPMVRGRKSLIGVYAFEAETWHRALLLISSGLVDPQSMITHRMPLERAREGFELARKKEAAKVVFTP